MENIEIIDFEEVKPFSVLKNYADELTARQYITNPAIARETEIKKLIINLLTPEKSALIVGKPGIGKTALVEGLAYLIGRNNVPDALSGYRIYKINSGALVGTINHGNRVESILNLLIIELQKMSKVIIFIDEIHTLIGNNDSFDLANALKPAIDRGNNKVIGATTDSEFERYIVRDRAFLRRFERIDVVEPDADTTVQILMETMPKIEHQTGIKFRYSNYQTKLLVESIVQATSEYKRIYGLAAMYPDIAFSVLTQAFSQALFHNKKEVTIIDVYNAIKTSKRIYPDSIVKELAIFKVKFKDLLEEEGLILPSETIEEISNL